MRQDHAADLTLDRIDPHGGFLQPGFRVGLMEGPVLRAESYLHAASSRERGARMGTVTKKNLIDHVSNLTGQRRHDVKDVIQTFLEQMIVELGHGNRLEFRDFGVFEIKRRAPRVAQNPKTLEPVAVPPKNTVKFKVGRLMKERLDESLPTAASDHPGDESHPRRADSGEKSHVQTVRRLPRREAAID